MQEKSIAPWLDKNPWAYPVTDKWGSIRHNDPVYLEHYNAPILIDLRSVSPRTRETVGPIQYAAIVGKVASDLLGTTRQWKEGNPFAKVDPEVRDILANDETCLDYVDDMWGCIGAGEPRDAMVSLRYIMEKAGLKWPAWAEEQCGHIQWDEHERLCYYSGGAKSFDKDELDYDAVAPPMRKDNGKLPLTWRGLRHKHLQAYFTAPKPSASFTRVPQPEESIPWQTLAEATRTLGGWAHRHLGIAPLARHHDWDVRNGKPGRQRGAARDLGYRGIAAGRCLADFRPHDARVHLCALAEEKGITPPPEVDPNIPDLPLGGAYPECASAMETFIFYHPLDTGWVMAYLADKSLQRSLERLWIWRPERIMGNPPTRGAIALMDLKQAKEPLTGAQVPSYFTWMIGWVLQENFLTWDEYVLCPPLADTTLMHQHPSLTQAEAEAIIFDAIALWDELCNHEPFPDDYLLRLEELAALRDRVGGTVPDWWVHQMRLLAPYLPEYTPSLEPALQRFTTDDAHKRAARAGGGCR